MRGKMPELAFSCRSFWYQPVSTPLSEVCCRLNRDGILWSNIKSFCVECKVQCHRVYAFSVTASGLLSPLIFHFIYWSLRSTGIKLNQGTYAYLSHESPCAMAFDTAWYDRGLVVPPQFIFHSDAVKFSCSLVTSITHGASCSLHFSSFSSFLVIPRTQCPRKGGSSVSGVPSLSPGVPFPLTTQ